MDKVIENLSLNSGKHIPDISENSFKCLSCIHFKQCLSHYPCLICSEVLDLPMSDLLIYSSFYECRS